MKNLYESRYMNLKFNEQKNIIEETWHSASKEMTEEEFKDEILKTLKYMNENRPKFYLVNSKDLKFAIAPKVQEWMHQNFIIPFVKIGVKKAAFVISEELVTEMSVEQTTEEDKEGKFKRQFFNNYEKALKWLIQ